MAKFQSREEYEKWKEDKTKPKQEPIVLIEQPNNQTDKGVEEKAAVSYNCPSCNSENIQKASVLVSMGSKKMSATTLGVGGGSSGINAGIGLTGGSIISELAAKLSPPIKSQTADKIRASKCFFPVFIIMFFYTCFYSFDKGYTGPGFFFLGSAVFSIWLGYFILIPNWKQTQAHQEKEYTRAMAQWGKTYFCLRCGKSFEINSPS